MHTGEGFDKFVETVEYSLGAEDPEEFAKKEYEMQQQIQAARARAKKKSDSSTHKAQNIYQFKASPHLLMMLE